VDVAGLLIGLYNVLFGIVIVMVALPLSQGKVAMNHFYGVRVRRSFESEEKWYKINRFGGRQLMIWGAIIAAMGAMMIFLDLEKIGEGMYLFLFVPLLVLVPAVRSVLYARRT
jgi:uncharacterized membrane protein